MRLQAGATLIGLRFRPEHCAARRDLGLGALAFLGQRRADLRFASTCFADQECLHMHPLIDALQAQPDAAMFIATAIAAMVAAPLFEEFVFRVIAARLVRGGSSARRRVLRLGLPGEGPAWWPIVLSSLLCATMHCDKGPAPIPLFFFAARLGLSLSADAPHLAVAQYALLLNAGTMIILWTQIGHVAA